MGGAVAGCKSRLEVGSQVRRAHANTDEVRREDARERALWDAIREDHRGEEDNVDKEP